MTKKIAISTSHSGFRLSKQVMNYLQELKNTNKLIDEYTVNREDTDLIKAIESFPDFSQVKIVEIPEDIEYTIEEYDGKEWIAEVHRTWR